MLDSPFGAIHEQITEFSPNRGYRYRVLQGSPLYCHQGEVRLTPCGGGTRVDWQIRFRSRIPGLGVPLRYLLEHKLNAALAGLRRQLTS
ncbi:Polyketide cyclase / dehydrase and lipid transport [compost metagenome]